MFIHQDFFPDKSKKARKKSGLFYSMSDTTTTAAVKDSGKDSLSLAPPHATQQPQGGQLGTPPEKNNESIFTPVIQPPYDVIASLVFTFKYKTKFILCQVHTKTSEIFPNKNLGHTTMDYAIISTRTHKGRIRWITKILV